MLAQTVTEWYEFYLELFAIIQNEMSQNKREFAKDS
jgi:hypothetical protein